MFSIRFSTVKCQRWTSRLVVCQTDSGQKHRPAERSWFGLEPSLELTKQQIQKSELKKLFQFLLSLFNLLIFVLSVNLFFFFENLQCRLQCRLHGGPWLLWKPLSTIMSLIWHCRTSMLSNRPLGRESLQRKFRYETGHIVLNCDFD